MYQNNKQTKYYIYDYRNSCYIAICYGLQDLIKHIAIWNYISADFDDVSCETRYKKQNTILNHYNCTTNDKEYVFSYDDLEQSKMYLRPYIIFDENYRIIDVRNYKNEILACDKPRRNYQSFEKYKPEFRKGPVPRTGKCCLKIRSLRHPKTTQEIRQNSIPEYNDFVRDKRKHIPTIYDDIFRHCDRSSKSQSKKRKQWM